MNIMDVFTITDRGTVLTGQVKSGSISTGDTVCIPLKDGDVAARTVNGIERFRKILDHAEKGQMVGLLVEVDKKQVKKGELLHDDCELTEQSES
jgi:translation elongation factor EF-Tu-like GTPase